MEAKIDKIIDQMTLEVKVSMLAGADWWHSVPVERAGIPVLKVTDGPNGARGVHARGGPTSASFPIGTALASTWNVKLAEKVGEALADEAKAKGAHVLLAPTVNIHRSPLAGRNFECYSEDPYLTARMAIAYINGLQSQGIGACIKHFVCNDSEFERMSLSSEVNERALREIYLYPFQVALAEAKPWTIMSAYNKINGTYASENTYTLLDILKGEWGFDGMVISDWYGTYSPNITPGGLDLEMPGPARHAADALELVQSGQVDEAVLDDKIRRTLRTLFRVGAFDSPELKPEGSDDKPKTRKLIRKVGGEAIVLLKNKGGILPVKPKKVKQIAVIGYNAKYTPTRGGGSSRVNPYYEVSALDAIKERVGDKAKVKYAVGTRVHRLTPLINVEWLRTMDGEQTGLTLEYFNNRDLSGDPAATVVTDNLHMRWADSLPDGVNRENFSARLKGTLQVPESNTYEFNLASAGTSRLFIAGEELIDNWTDYIFEEGYSNLDKSAKLAQVQLESGKSYPIQIDFASAENAIFKVVRLGCMVPIPKDSIAEAVKLATKSDIVLLFAGLTEEWDSEGFDRLDMELPGEQAKLIKKVSKANPNTVVVLSTGSSVVMPWLKKVPAVLETWYLGQEAGNAIADVIFGDVNPSGKLTQTFPKRLQDNPAYINYPGENGKVYYGEGIFVGYRYYEAKDVEPLFPFGYGLSYTKFKYSNLKLDKVQYTGEDEIQVSLDVKNTGKVAGKEVVQVYVRDVKSKLVRPEKELKGFAKVALDPGETKTVTITLDQAALSYYDDASKQWIAEPGKFQALVGSSSQDIHLKAKFKYLGDPE
ncbi:MAG: glycoside hydrolase family 3 C-terminal domain-containing protein [Anaerolineales bacterium]|nr:glycoside hydrolase family 3 C-terminal domain-containing protein [Anaerolineales bacterium]